MIASSLLAYDIYVYDVVYECIHDTRRRTIDDFLVNISRSVGNVATQTKGCNFTTIQFKRIHSIRFERAIIVIIARRDLILQSKNNIYETK